MQEAALSPRLCPEREDGPGPTEKAYNFARSLSMADGGAAPLPDVRRARLQLKSNARMRCVDTDYLERNYDRI